VAVGPHALHRVEARVQWEQAETGSDSSDDHVQMLGRNFTLRCAFPCAAIAFVVATLLTAIGAAAQAVPQTTVPYFMAGPQCSDEGVGYIRWRVENTEAVTHHLVIAVEGQDVVGPIKVKPGVTRSGTLSHTASGSAVKSVVARWSDVGHQAAATLLMHLSLCSGGEPRGPWFIAGQYCKAGNNKVRFKLENTADETIAMSATVTNEFNQGSTRIWPSDAPSKAMASGARITKNRIIPAPYGPGDEVRLRGWWLTGDPSAHNRVAFELLDCGGSS
jgi:hypothetical protein